MKKTHLFALWGSLFIICAGLGFIPESTGFLRFALTALSLAFFLPPAVLLYRAKQANDLDTVQLIRNLSALSLAVTLVTLILNFLSAFWPEFWGNVLHGILVVVSSPMVCSGYWVLSLFGWACLLVSSVQMGKKR